MTGGTDSQVCLVHRDSGQLVEVGFQQISHTSKPKDFFVIFQYMDGWNSFLFCKFNKFIHFISGNLSARSILIKSITNKRIIKVYLFWWKMNTSCQLNWAVYYAFEPRCYLNIFRGIDWFLLNLTFQTLTLHTEPVLGLRFVGKFLATGGRDRTIRVTPLFHVWGYVSFIDILPSTYYTLVLWISVTCP